ncbi:30S ribosomal protein S15 [Mycoplasma iguanae]|uniref:Small ribosomal subunit protein uS15 n=1 Tax=Mycoplasma iguanae TaxID=292461 RepID=A0ABY5R7W1_9MOLU|nr:30S ribosomal protein S15 [Mycoplasma iguanae]UVD81574.1 30S ribosomal protein S15 [Mycoplasma iguanae]
MLSKEQKKELLVKFGGSETNSGASEVQIAILTAEIESLKLHFKDNKKDKHSMRGFIAKVNKRKKLLSYLKSKNFDKYQSLIKELGIRK